MSKIKRKRLEDLPRNGLILPPIEEHENGFHTLPTKGKTPKIKISRKRSTMKSGLRTIDPKQYV